MQKAEHSALRASPLKELLHAEPSGRPQGMGGGGGAAAATRFLDLDGGALASFSAASARDLTAAASRSDGVAAPVDDAVAEAVATTTTAAVAVLLLLLTFAPASPPLLGDEDEDEALTAPPVLLLLGPALAVASEQPEHTTPARPKLSGATSGSLKDPWMSSVPTSGVV